MAIDRLNARLMRLSRLPYPGDNGEGAGGGGSNPPPDDKGGDPPSDDKSGKSGDPPSDDPPADDPPDKTYPASYVKELRTESAKNRVVARDALAKVTTLEQRIKELEGKSTGDPKVTEDLNKALERITALETEKKDALWTAGIAASASKAGIDITLAERLLRKDEVEFDEKGNPTNIETVLKTILEAHPALVSGNGGSGTRFPRQPNGDPLKTTDIANSYIQSRYGTPAKKE